ncbi:MAG: beta-hydroxyacyl-ACP dehydratase [Phycisphaera sp.]|nr:MAG: beta-hydroxyacyl-ACP dehydratase [Phycisphaera sp.]
MHFRLIDRVLERTETQITAIKVVSAAEEYLQDHFPMFPVLPGVFMLEAMVQTGREFALPTDSRLVLGRVRALKYGSFVRPGDVLTCEVKLLNRFEDGSLDLKGKATVGCASGSGPSATACSGRFLLRPVRFGSPGVNNALADGAQTETTARS